MPSQNSPSYKVLFAEDSSAGAPPGTLVIMPAKDGWNDFGSRIRVDIVIRPFPGPSDQSFTASGFLGFVHVEDRYADVRTLQRLLSESKRNAVPAEEAPPFFTMLPDMAAYREIVHAMGPTEARRILAGLHDMVEADHTGVGRPWLKDATGSELFRQAFLRTTEAFFAWKNAGMFFRGIGMEEVGRLSEELRISFRLAGRPNDHDLQFQFSLNEPLLPKRFAVLIGKNGVGKSQTLGRIAQAAISGLPTLTDGAGHRPLFNRILAFYPTSVASDTFPPERQRRSRVWYRRLSLGGAGYGRSRRMTADLIVQLARTQERIRDTSRFDIFLTSLRALESHEELAFATHHPHGFVLLTDLLRGGEQRKLERFADIDPNQDVVRLINDHAYPLSSGELGFVRFAAMASLYIENSSLLLFDEPETHLHPNFISQFVALLDRLLEQTGSAAIIATHSVYFVREAFEDQVRVLRSGADRAVTVETPMLRTFGADVGAVSYFVFGEDEPSRLAQSVENEIASLAMSWEDVFALYKDRLSLELLGEIRARIEGLDQKSTRS